MTLDFLNLSVDEIEKSVLDEPVAKWRNRNLNDLGPLVDEMKDPNVLFRHNWLGKGQAFGLVASSGVGKSSMADQMAFHWALGETFLAAPTRALKIAVIQAEDSDRDLQEQRDGMIRGLMSEGWSAAKVDKAIKSVDFSADFIGRQGDDFINLLTDYQHDNRYDLIILNPLQRVFGGDVSSQEDASHFCAGIDRILKSDDYGCAMGIVMHTAKFHSGIKDGRQSVDDYAEYAMAGSQEWTAWIRAVINFQKHGTSEDYFDIKASKRGKRLGWKDANGEPTTKRIFKHSDGFIYWQEVTDEGELASIQDDGAKRPKREPKEPLDVSASCVYWANRIAGSSELQEMGANDIRDVIYEGMKSVGRIREDARKVYDELVTNFTQYGLKQGVNKFGKKTLVPEGSDDDELPPF